ncbi:MAG: hypothetical protein RBG13Loki_0093 [Promethearchaeota archaeon CR_4]|nr:MAG: hypothetical protein RBG13Loki_0093 [Candidatus Lokiarchaeota archaeon CR_4]
MGKEKEDKKSKKDKKQEKSAASSFASTLGKGNKGQDQVAGSVNYQMSPEMKKVLEQAGLKAVKIDNRHWSQILYDEPHWTRLPFTHGLEMELALTNAKGDYLPGDEMVFRMKECTRAAKGILCEIIENTRSDFYPKGGLFQMPNYIRKKMVEMPSLREDIEKGLAMDIKYWVPISGNRNGIYVTVDSYARDGNVTAITYILELVTPPCEYAEELAYWAATLFQLAKITMPKDLNIVASALNPATKEYQRGLTQGDHHHIGYFGNDLERAQCFDMVRNFIPHIIALSCNSPILNNKPTDVVKVINGRIAAPNCVRSLRINFNTTMLSSNDPKHFLPYLTDGSEKDKAQYLRALSKASMEDARFQDVFPFTDWNTMEIRIMDAQLSICRRIGLGMLVQALCYKARKYLNNKKWVPDAGAANICANRQTAYTRGLMGLWKTVNTYQEFAKLDHEFAKCYVGEPNKPVRYIFDAVKNMFIFLRNELKELGFLYHPFFKPLLQSVFGSISYALPPLNEADYQLSLFSYKQQQGQEPNILRDLIYFTLEYSKDPISQPLTGDLWLPAELRI